MIAMQAGIIDEKIFVGLVVITMVTILIAGPLMKYYLEKQIKEEKLEEEKTTTPLPDTAAVLSPN